jgi:large subunit ribosomal protein L15
MSILAERKSFVGSRTAPKRLGRGRGSGLGQLSGKGHKGQLARTGGKVRRGFEGGQSPLSRRSPKFGFTNEPFRTRFQVVNIEQLKGLKGEVSPEILKKMGLIKRDLAVKILGRGQIEGALVVKAHAFSRSAQEAIQKAGGTVEVIK